MRTTLKVSAIVFALSLILLILNLFDIVAFPTPLYRACGVVCLITLFITVFTRVWLITYRRKFRKNRFI
ncbi:MAG: hypothetical protein K2K94_02345 [Muribaculaceae bacterium]|nr:hypothetical protein [Muribaculaceae bacterium]